ncbi:Structural maintenance of chromosomes protein 4, partial [Sesamum angolense]
KYDTAISTACPGLDYIVVETTAAAQACVELLRSQNLGVATFMILEKQAHHVPRLKERIVTPEGVPRLFDLINVQDERMKLAFFAALGNTILAENIDQATRIAYGGKKEFWRVVTLEGALFEKSGTMTGGGGKPRGGKMGTSIRAASVSGEAMANAEKELSDLVESLSNIRKKLGDAVKHYRDSEKAISPLEMEFAKSQKEVDSLKLLLSDLEKQLDSLKAASEPLKDEVARLKELGNIISAEEKEIERLMQGSKQLKEKASELQNKIENAGGERLKNQKSKVNKIQSDIDKNSTEINRRKVQIETGQKTIKKLTKGIEESRNEKERLMGEKEKLSSTFKEIEQKAFIVQENYKKTQEVSAMFLFACDTRQIDIIMGKMIFIDQHKDVLDQAKSDYEKLKKIVDELRTSEVDAEYKLQDKRKACKELEIKGKAYKKKLDDLQVALSKHMEQIHKDLVDPEKLQTVLTDVTLGETCDLKRALEMVALLEAQLKDMNPNLDSISEYREKVSLYNERVADLNLITQQRDDVKKQYDEWRKRRLDEFMAGFNTISLKLKEMYQMITLGGDAELELVDSLDPFSEGVVFSVRPPKKSWKNIANLSGGEKTLSSLALVFALHHYKPTPLYVMDEIDAALDFKNVSIVGHYVKDRTKDAQFIIISLRNNMFELADRLVGIYKTDNCTKSITINPGSFVVCEQAS